MKMWVGILVACFLIVEPITLAGDLQTGNRTTGSMLAAATADKTRAQLITYEAAHMKDSSFPVSVAVRAFPPQQNQPKERSWIGRHPVLSGTAVGFGAGFAYGYTTGDPAARNCPGCDNLTPEAKGVLFGGIGAGIGAVAGFIVGAIRK